MPVVIGCSVRPPNGAALAEATFGAVYASARSELGVTVTGAFRDRDGATSFHEFRDQSLASGVLKIRVGSAPQASANNEISAVRGATSWFFARHLQPTFPAYRATNSDGRVAVDRCVRLKGPIEVVPPYEAKRLAHAKERF
jgi:hypothetical protein